MDIQTATENREDDLSFHTDADVPWLSPERLPSHGSQDLTPEPAVNLCAKMRRRRDTHGDFCLTDRRRFIVQRSLLGDFLFHFLRHLHFGGLSYLVSHRGQPRSTGALAGTGYEGPQEARSER